MVSENLGNKLFGHKSTDATSVKSREKSCRKNTPGKNKNAKPGRPKKGQNLKKEPRRLNLQPERTLEENLADLPM
jgi:hypothetical protein